MDSATVEQDLVTFLNHAKPLVQMSIPNANKVCFKHPGEVSVAWTHGHFFDTTVNPSPDNVNEKNAYCAVDPFSDTTAAAAHLVEQLK